MIDITPIHLETIQRILAEHVPDCEVRAFGSRVTWTAKDYSDLDLAVVGARALDLDTLRRLKEAFEESNLPFWVDVLDWHAISNSFRKVIEKNFEVIQRGGKKGRGIAGEWREVAVEEIKAPTENALATGPFGSSIGSRFFLESGVPVIRGSNLSEDIGTRLSDKGLVFLNPEKAREFARSIVRDGDLVFTCWGTVNQVGLIDRRAKYQKYVISNKQMKLTPDPEQADSLFLYYLFSGPELQNRIKNQSIGSSVPGFNLGQLRAMRIRIPDVLEQRAIAHILGTLDDKIELNRRMNETLEAMTRALFKSWFVNFDPVRAKAEGRDPGLPKPLANLFPNLFEDSELGEIPKGWKVRSIGDLAEVVGGSTPSTSNPAFWDGGQHYWATPKDLASLKSPVLLCTERRITDAGLGEIGSGLLPVGTVLLSSRAPIGYLVVAEAPVAMNQGFIAMKPTKGVSNLFLLFWAHFAAEEILSRANGSTFLEISKANFRPIPVAAPAEPILGAFDAHVRPMYQKIVCNERESRTLAALRDTLLPKLISGELRVKDADKIVEAAT